jgi:hypothetical protein
MARLVTCEGLPGSVSGVRQTLHSWYLGIPACSYPTFHRARRFIPVLTTALHRSLSLARSILSITLHPA